jgi:hypothetical protein
MGGDQVPIDLIMEERVDVPVADSLVGPVEDGVADAPHPRHQLDSKSPGQAEDRFALSLRIGMERVGLDLRPVFLERVEDMDALPDAAGDEAGKQCDIGAGDVMVGDAAVAAIANVG